MLLPRLSALHCHWDKEANCLRVLIEYKSCVIQSSIVMNIVSSFSVHGTRVAACLGPVELSTNLNDDITITEKALTTRAVA